MGGEISTLNKIPDQSTILSKTQSTSFVMNRILEYILRNVTIADLISLGTDEGCKEWIVIAEKKLKVLFKTMDLYPRDGSEGLIYFTKIKDLQDKSSDDPKAKDVKDKYCKILAFFYIRLFQVIGALALSVQDSSLPLQELMPGEQSSTYVPEDYKQSVPFIPAQQEKKKFSFFGGNFDYSFMDNYLQLNPGDEAIATYSFNSFPEKTRIGTTNQFNVKRTTYPGIIVKKTDEKYYFEVTRQKTEITFNFYISDNKVIIDNVYKSGRSLEGYAKKEVFALQSNKQLIVGSENLDFAAYINSIINKILTLEKSQIINIFNKLNYFRKIDENTYRIIDTNITTTTKEMKEPLPTFLYAVETTIDNKKVDISIMFDLILTNLKDNIVELTINNPRTTSKTYIVPKLAKANFNFKLQDGQLTFDDDSDTELKRNKQTIPKFLESQMTKLADKITESLQYGFAKQREGYVRPIVNVKSVSPLKYTELWETLQKTPPIKSFCVARALQLLNLSGLSQQVPKTILPLIYKSKFPYIQNKSLPSPGQPIIESAPFKALNQLFISPKDVLSLKIDNKYLPTNSTRDASLLKILESFEQTNKTLETVLEDKGSELNSITDKTKINDLRYQAKQLFQIQFNHTDAVLKLIKKIFNISVGTIEFNQNIAQKGLRGIEEIAQEARDLLTDYYSKCQTEYVKGVNILTKKQVALPPKPM
jgi:hypothetical protein